MTQQNSTFKAVVAFITVVMMLAQFAMVSVELVQLDLHDETEQSTSIENCGDAEQQCDNCHHCHGPHIGLISAIVAPGNFGPITITFNYTSRFNSFEHSGIYRPPMA